MSDVLDDIADAKASYSGQLPFPEFGDYVAEVQSITGRNGEKGPSGRIELKILESGRIVDNDKHNVDPTPAGDSCVIIENFGKKGAKERFKGFILAIMNEPKATPERYKVLANQQTQPAAFSKIKLRAYRKETEKGAVVTGYVVKAIPPATQADLDAINAKRAAAKLPKLEDAIK